MTANTFKKGDIVHVKAHGAALYRVVRVEPSCVVPGRFLHTLHRLDGHMQVAAYDHHLTRAA